MRYTRADWESGVFSWVLVLTYAGKEYLLPSNTITPPAGKAWAGIIEDAITFSQEANWEALGAEVLSVAFTNILTTLDIAALVERGYPITSGTGSLCIWKEGTSWEDRQKVYTGSIVAPTYGAVGEGVSFSLEANPYDDTVTLPESTISYATLGSPTGSAAVTLAETPLDTMGSSIPVVIGNPGVYTNEDGILSYMAGSLGYGTAPYLPPTPWYIGAPGASMAIYLAGRSFPQGWESSTAIVWDGTNRATLNIYPSNDASGDAIAWAAILSSSGLDINAGEYGICWLDQGGIDGRAGEVLDWFLKTSSLQVDQGRVDAAKSFLNTYTLAGYINEQGTAPIDWLTDNYLSILPVTLSWSGDGVYPVPCRFRATAEEAIATISPSYGASRTGKVEYIRSPDEIENSITLNHCMDALTGEYTQGLKLDTADSLASQAVYGLQPSEESSTILWERGTVAAVVDWLQFYRGYCHRTITYELPPSWNYLDLGDVVKVQDTELSIDRVGLIKSISRDADLWVTVTVLLLGG